MTLAQMRARLKAAQAELVALKAKLEDGSATSDDVTKSGELATELKTLKDGIKSAEDALRHLADVGTADQDEPAVERTARTVPAAPTTEAPKFKTFGEMLQAVAEAGMNKGAAGYRAHPALKYQVFGIAERAIQGANTITPSEGGFLVQQDFSTMLMDMAHEVGILVPRCTQLQLSSNANSMKLPSIDETSRTDGSRWGGVQAYWVAEGQAGTKSKPKFREINIGVEKLMCLGYATDEMLSDAAVLETIMGKAFSEEIAYTVDDAVMNGDGAGKPLGFMNSGALITVDKESGQAADTIVGWNVIRMLARTPVRSRSKLVWLVNRNLEPQLWTLTHPTNADILLYKPPGLSGNVMANAPDGTLLGRPVVFIEQAAAVGNVGDITLVDLDHYLLLTKGGLQSATSMHVEFLTDQMTYRFVYRVGGQSTTNQPVTTADGATTLSPFVALQAR
jgi:HK97 family phage major capsid protein